MTTIEDLGWFLRNQFLCINWFSCDTRKQNHNFAKNQVTLEINKSYKIQSHSCYMTKKKSSNFYFLQNATEVFLSNIFLKIKNI